MSDFDEKDIIKTAGSDFDPADVIDSDFAEEKVKPKPSEADSALAGLQQGVTWGSGDEIKGGIEGGLDKLQSLMAKIGLASPSPTDVNAKLAAEGVKGDVGPTSGTELYRQARDENRAENQAAMDENPWSFGAGAVAGGALTIPFTPGAIAAPLGAAAPGATVATRMALAARNAVPAAAIGSANMSNADLTRLEVDKFAADTIEGTGLGVVAAPLLVAGGAGLGAIKDGAKKVGSAITPNPVKTAYQRGIDGIKTTTQEFYDATRNKLNGVVDEMAAPINAKTQSQVAAHEAKIAGIDDNIAKIEADTKANMALDESRQLAQNKQDLVNINKETVDTAKRLQTKIYDVKKALGRQYDEIDAAADKTGVIPDSRDLIREFYDTVKFTSGLPENEVESIVKRMVPSMDGANGIQDYKNLKSALNRYFDHANPVVKKAAKTAFANLKSNYSSSLEQAGYQGLAKRISEVNKRWSATSEMEDQFLSNLKPNRVTGNIEASPDTINALGSFKQNNPKEMANSEFFGNLLNEVTPTEAPGILQGLDDLGQRTNQIKNFTPKVDATPNPELVRLQELLLQAKKFNPQKVEGLSLAGNADAMKKQLTNMVPKYKMNSGKDVIENDLDDVMKFLEKEKGPEYTQDLQKRLKPITDDVELRNSQISGSDDVPVTWRDASRKVVGQASKLSNAVGLGNKAVSDNVKKVTTGPVTDLVPDKIKAFATTGVKKLSDASPEQIKRIAQKMSEVGGKSGAEFSRVLSNGMEKNNVSRNAIMFGLMQQPEFRALFQQIEEQESSDGPIK